MAIKSSLSRRALFPLSGGVAFSAIAPIASPEFDSFTHGVKVSLIYRWGKWCVAVPMEGPHWHPGMAPALEFIPLRDYLRQVELACEIPVDGDA